MGLYQEGRGGLELSSDHKSHLGWTVSEVPGLSMEGRDSTDPDPSAKCLLAGCEVMGMQPPAPCWDTGTVLSLPSAAHL